MRYVRTIKNSFKVRCEYGTQLYVCIMYMKTKFLLSLSPLVAINNYYAAWPIDTIFIGSSYFFHPVLKSQISCHNLITMNDMYQ